MPISDITISDFKTQFSRDFSFLLVWNDDTSYNKDEEVYYDTNRLFYTALNDEVTTDPTDTSDWIKTDDSLENYVLDEDINKAFLEAKINFNNDLGFDDDTLKILYLYLSAHYLCLDVRRSLQGIMSKGEFNTTSKSVGSVSESYAIPDKFLKDPYLNYFTKTEFGLKYLSILIPYLIGNVGCIQGATTP